MSIVTQDNTVLLHMKPSELLDDPDNLRTNLGDLGELAQSIAAVGVLEPLLVRNTPDGPMVVAGHRRKAAAQLAVDQGLVDDGFVVPLLLVDATAEQVTEAMLIENLQRADLDPLEEAQGYARLVGLGMAQKEIAAKVGRGAAHVSRRLGLLQLPERLQEKVAAGKIGLDEAATLVTIKDEKVLAELAGKKNLQSWEIQQAATQAKGREACEKLARAVRKADADVVLVLTEDDAKEANESVKPKLLVAGDAVHDFDGTVPASATHALVSHTSGNAYVRFLHPATSKQADQRSVLANTGGVRWHYHRSSPSKKELAERDAAAEARQREAARAEVVDAARTRFLTDAVIAKPKKGDVAAYAVDFVVEEFCFGDDYGRVFDAEEAIELFGLTAELDAALSVDNEAARPHSAGHFLFQWGQKSETNKTRLALAAIALGGGWTDPLAVGEDGPSTWEKRVAADYGFDEAAVPDEPEPVEDVEDVDAGE